MEEEKDGYIYGLDTLEFNGKEIGMIDEDGIDWGGSDPTIVKLWAAQRPGAPVKTFQTNNGEDELAFNLIELKASNLKDVAGGEVDAATGKWSAPSKVVNLEGPVKITTGDGTQINIKNARLVGKPKGKINYKDVLKMPCKLMIQMPADGSSPWDIGPTQKVGA